MTTAKHQILVVGGGTADIAVAARMLAKHRPVIAVDGGRIVLRIRIGSRPRRNRAQLMLS